MIFTSYTYVAFLLIVFVLNWLLPSGWRNAFLVIASYVFYAAWKWEFAFLLLGLSLFNWAYARWVIARAEGIWALSVGIGANLAALLYFKYTNFLLTNLASATRLLGSDWQPAALDIILPLGISFFTFQGIAYLFDVATGEDPLESLTSFLLFKALWPQLIAGPIIRLHEIRSQLEARRTIAYDDVTYGAQRILFGFFKKVVLADNLAPYVDLVFVGRGLPAAIDVAVAVLAFALQIYFDFSAYSDIAIGSARLFGFRFPENFNWPYLARSPQDFWNRWHMTLSRWIRDYLYTPLSFSTRSKPVLAPLWMLFAMAICGLWHGAQWTFVVWGLWHGLLLVFGAFFGRRATAGPRAGPPVAPEGIVRSFVSWALTFAAVCLGWLVFRAPSLSVAGSLLGTLASLRGGLHPALLRENAVLVVAIIFAGLLIAQVGHGWIARTPSAWRTRLEPAFRIAKPIVYVGLLLAVIVFDQEAKAFVYFQF